jgi:ankyrin repeat protein
MNIQRYSNRLLVAALFVIILITFYIPYVGAEERKRPRNEVSSKAIEAIILAIGLDDLSMLQDILNQGSNPNTQISNSSKLTPLMIAETEAQVRLLLSRGANPNLIDVDGSNAIHHAALKSDALALIPLLLQYGANINAPANGRNGETPLMAAKEWFYGIDPVFGEQVIRLLVSNGADLNAVDKDGYTSLISAAVNDKTDLLQLLINLGADPRHKTKDGYTALDWAKELSHEESIKILERVSK